MKKSFLFAAAVAALLTCACSVEPVDPMDVQPEEDGEITVLTAGFASGEDGTRTVRQADGKVFWSPKDAIHILRGTKKAKFISSNTEPAATASFTGTMPSGAGAFWAVYPYHSDDNLQAVSGNTVLVTSLPAEQEAVAGSFADELFISAAYVRNNVKNLTFYHQCGGVKFSVTQPGIKRVSLIPADPNVSLAGLFGIYAASPGDIPYIAAYGSADYMYNIVELTAPEGETLAVGEAYHIVTIPAYLSGGFTLLFEKEDGTFAKRTISQDVTIRAARFATLLDVDKGLKYRKDFLDYTPGEVVVEGLGGAFAIDVQGTLEYHIDVNSDWIHEVSASGDLRLGRRHAFFADRNDEGTERTGMLSICFGENCYPILVTQSAVGEMKVYPHHTLGMRFTATWCQYCPYMDATFRKAKEAMGDAFEYVCIYANSGNYGFAGSDGLTNYYQIGGYPSGIIDGWFELPNYSSADYGASVIAEVAKETVQYYPTATAIGLESTLSGQNLSVKVDVKAQYEEDYKITVFLCENDIIGEQKRGSSVISDFNHSRVTRMSLTSYLGDLFEGPAAGDVKTLHFTATIPSEYKTENMDVVAFVQRNFNDRPAIQSGHYGDWYVDNCRAAKVGAAAPLEVE